MRFQQHLLHNFPNYSEKREMSQSRLGESSNSFNNNNSFSNNTNSFNTINNTINNTASVDERDKILTWLSPLEPRIRHQDIRAHRVEHVGDWLLGTEEYQNWRDDVHSGELNKSTLFVMEIRGSGRLTSRKKPYSP